jgi:hypothetical protein
MLLILLQSIPIQAVGIIFFSITAVWLFDANLSIIHLKKSEAAS